ncbi:putative disease resistance protein [Prunus yedoensis var. nudiflora]|uniref:Putative disease resistance protein n=1 Tax=Prunus yedoensis var. nudiflora TaxID=2094558 RepID=A0A314XZJ7_PRUYE|nr:putative disease resistance protein [Prunus yedoensis var. nudiflora]
MHDVIRDMALWLACDLGTEGENILVDTGAYQAPNVAKWKNAKKGFIDGGSYLKRIVDDFFDIMPTLRVLDLSENILITQLPTGVANLVSLQHLNLSKTGHKMVVGGVRSMCTPKVFELRAYI